ncbi:hypothetical protein [Pseudomonas sp.]|uniref:COG4315 family predicted lipoprotein n=1 Tax=Pseudomonas sp. TaxID=306 RepID=UPI0026305433|nr:hypothetical protein [Pseudomonas sp.]
MSHSLLSFKAVLLGAVLALPGLALAEPAMTHDGVLVTHDNKTLYTFAKDSAGKSACNDACAKNWPPLEAASTDKSMGKWTVITRDDEHLQWAYDGKPLYTFVKDEKAGDKTGDGKMDGAWKVAKP